jgi:hypothetical protein
VLGAALLTLPCSACSEAKSALLKVITILEANEASIKQLITEAGDDQQKKMMTVVPALQALLGPVLVEFGFPPPPMGAQHTHTSVRLLSPESRQPLLAPQA